MGVQCEVSNIMVHCEVCIVHPKKHKINMFFIGIVSVLVKYVIAFF